MISKNVKSYSNKKMTPSFKWCANCNKLTLCSWIISFSVIKAFGKELTWMPSAIHMLLLKYTTNTKITGITSDTCFSILIENMQNWGRT